MKCFIYRNLNRKGYVYSLKAMEGPHKGRVVALATAITVVDARFVVSDAGRERARKEGQRNVHAGVVGNVVNIQQHTKRLPHPIKVAETFVRKANGTSVTYDTWKYDTFVRRDDEQPVHDAKEVQFFLDRVTAFGLT